MSSEITWLGHACFQIQTGGQSVLIDPYLNDSPSAPVRAEEVDADVVLLTHGHFDHITDAVSIAKRTGATVVAILEIAAWLKKQGVAEEKVIAMNIGGTLQLPLGRVKMTMAQHSSSLPDGSCGGSAAGFLLELGNQRVYVAGDTAPFLDMKMIAMGGIDLAVLPIGDVFTMGPEDSIQAIKMLDARTVIPCHYNTWPPIEQDAQAWAEEVRRNTSAEPVVLEPGEKYQLS